MVHSRKVRALSALVAASLAFSAQAKIESLQDVPISISTITAEDIEKLPTARDISDIAFIQPGESITVRGNHSGVAIGTRLSPPLDVDGAPQSSTTIPSIEGIEVLRGPSGTLYGRQPMPIQIGTRRDGTQITNFTIPQDTPPGPIMLEFTPVDGDPYNREANVYAFLRAWLNQDDLYSGQRAQFGYDLSFGQGPGRITITINTAGPIRYDKNGQPQQLRIDEKGLATLKGYIQALQGSPTGIPFAITPTFSGLQLRKR